MPPPAARSKDPIADIVTAIFSPGGGIDL